MSARVTSTTSSCISVQPAAADAVVPAPFLPPSLRRDLKRRRNQCGLLFNALFNLHKFLGFENRDPFAQRNEAAEFAGLSEWEKFAKIEYYRCVRLLWIIRSVTPLPFGLAMAYLGDIACVRCCVSLFAGLGES